MDVLVMMSHGGFGLWFMEESMKRNFYTCAFYILLLKVPSLKVSDYFYWPTLMSFGELVKTCLQMIPREIWLMYICVYKNCVNYLVDKDQMWTCAYALRGPIWFLARHLKVNMV